MCMRVFMYVCGLSAGGCASTLSMQMHKKLFGVGMELLKSVRAPEHQQDVRHASGDGWEGR